MLQCGGHSAVACSAGIADLSADCGLSNSRGSDPCTFANRIAGWDGQSSSGLLLPDSILALTCVGRLQEHPEGCVAHRQVVVPLVGLLVLSHILMRAAEGDVDAL